MRYPGDLDSVRLVGAVYFPNLIVTAHSTANHGALAWPLGLLCFAGGLVKLAMARSLVLAGWMRRHGFVVIGLYLVLGVAFLAAIWRLALAVKRRCCQRPA